MAVRAGFKKSEVGLIPVNWQCTSIGEIASFMSGDGIAVSKLSPTPIDKHIPVYGGNGIAGYTDRATVNCPTLVIGRVGQRCGEAYLTADKAWITDNALYPKRILLDIDLRFFYWAVQGAGLNTVKNRNDLPLITQSILHNVRIPLPLTLVEQEAIAGALSDVDAWIESLEQLIAKKRQIKQGAMQELLTGKRRLPRFSGETVESRKLGTIGKWTGGMTPSMANPRYWLEGNFPWITSGDVKAARLWDTSQHITQEAVKSSATTVLPSGAVVIVNRSGILRRYLPVALLMREMAINQDLKGIVPNTDISSEYLLQAVTFHGPEILGTCLKSGTTVESIQLGWLKAFEIRVPKIEEQMAIGNALGEFDQEISNLESKLAKARQIKQAMMQELLTGRIRLVEPMTTTAIMQEAAHA